jgi:formiminotetrahydrofolate cyclodeaminase
MENVDRDAQSYEAVLRSLKLPKTTEAERATRDQAIEAASKTAAAVPLETAEMAAAVAREIRDLSGVTVSQAASDLQVAASLAETARRGGIENVRANLPSVHDEGWLRDVAARLQALEAE